MNEQLVSVIMPVYNGEKYLDEAIQSVLAQTYKNFEFIIINDGSRDKSLDIIEKYKNQDERIVVISRENKGLVPSLNEGIEKAKGKYVARMDADDLCMPNRFEEQLSYMEKNDLDLCGSWVETFSDKGTYGIWQFPEKNNEIIFTSFFMSSFIHPSVMVKTSVITNFKYDNELSEDYKLWCNILSNGFKSGNIQKVLLKYRFHPNQLTQTKAQDITHSANQTQLNFVRKMDDRLIDLVAEAIEVQHNNSYEKFHKFIQDILVWSEKYQVSFENTHFILKHLYNNSTPKSPLLYYLYYKATKKAKKQFKEEVKLFLKSLIVFNRDSVAFKLTKSIYARIK